MYLKSLELSGFKSFAKKTALEFVSPITAIVGPNGSGKSNIAEAFRFVLGEQSIKSMRGKRTEDLIWNGSPEMGRSGRAAVKLLFDNRPNISEPCGNRAGKRLLNLDFDSVTVERVIYRDASSEYLLNNSLVRLRDIVELLSGAHIGVSGHHIISQGEADRILNSSMKERREMIEDALGLKIYQWKREESERKLKKTEENMKQVEGLRKEIAPHLSFLKKQVEKLERMKTQKEELRSLYKEYLGREHAKIVFEKKKIEEEERAPRQEFNELEKQLSSVKLTLEKAYGKDTQTKAVIELEKKLNGLRKERDWLSRELGRIEGEISASEKLKKSKNAEESSEVLVPFSEIENIITKVEEARKKETDSIAVLRDVIEKIMNTLRSLAVKYSEKKTPAEERGLEEIRKLIARKKETEQRIDAVQDTEKKTAAEERELRLDIEKAKDSSRDAEKEVFRVMAGQNELRNVLNGLEIRRRDIAHKEDNFRRELAEGAVLLGLEIADYEKNEVLNPQEAGQETQGERLRKIEKLKIRIEDAGAGGGSEVLKEFEEASERDKFLSRELADLENGAKKLRLLISELEQKIDEEFNGGIEKINEEFQKFFSLMFGGGTAKLLTVKPHQKIRRETDEALMELEGVTDSSVTETSEDRETGIDIEVHLPRKKIKGLMMLSGGERALTSIALLFAVSQVNPPPFLVLDETDAPLDEANSKKYGDMVENLSKHSQLILITHNRETMSRAGVLYGVTMDRGGVSKLLSVAFDEAATAAK